MKSFSTAVKRALARGDAIVSASVAIYCSPAIFLWGGYGDWPIAGDTGTEVHKGVGDRAMAQVSGGVLGGAAQNINLRLSGVASEALDVLDATGVKDSPVVTRRLIFDNTGRTLLGGYVFGRGKADQLNTPETVGGEAAIELTVEGAARGLGRRGGRLASDADQRMMKPADNFFQFVSYAAEKTLYWAGKRPATAGSAVGGGGGSVLDGVPRLNYDQFVGAGN